MIPPRTAALVIAELHEYIRLMDRATWVDERGVAHPTITPFIREFAREQLALLQGKSLEPVEL